MSSDPRYSLVPVGARWGILDHATDKWATTPGENTACVGLTKWEARQVLSFLIDAAGEDGS